MTKYTATEAQLFEYSRLPLLVMKGCVFSLITLVAFDVYQQLSSTGAINSSPYILLGFVTFFSGCWVFFGTSIITLHEDSIGSVWFFGKKDLRLQEIDRILIYRSQGNPLAAMTKLISKNGSMTISSMVCNYDDLVDVLIRRCESAVIVNK